MNAAVSAPSARPSAPTRHAGTGQGPRPEGLRLGPGGPVVPRLRGLRDPQDHPAAHARARGPAGADRVRFRHRLRGALPVLHGHVRNAHDPRARARVRDRGEARQSGARRVARHRRRGRAQHRGQPTCCTFSGATWTSRSCCSTTRPTVSPRDSTRRRHGKAPEPRRPPKGRSTTPVSPLAFALGAGGRFLGRGIDTVRPRLADVVRRARPRAPGRLVHRDLPELPGVQRRCVRRVHRARPGRPSPQVEVAPRGAASLRGRNGELGLRLDPVALKLEVVEPGRDGVTDEDVCTHDETNRALAQLLIAMEPPHFPVATGGDSLRSGTGIRELGNGAARTGPAGTGRERRSRRLAPPGPHLAGCSGALDRERMGVRSAASVKYCG